MEDPEFADSDEVKLLAIWIDDKKNIGMEKDFVIDDE